MPASEHLDYDFLRASNFQDDGRLDLQRFLDEAHSRSRLLRADEVLVLSFDTEESNAAGIAEQIAEFVSYFAQHRTQPRERYLLLETNRGTLLAELVPSLEAIKAICAHRSIHDDRLRFIGPRPRNYDIVLRALSADPWVFSPDELTSTIPQEGGTIANWLREMFVDHGIIARVGRVRRFRRSQDPTIGQRIKSARGPNKFSALWRASTVE